MINNPDIDNLASCGIIIVDEYYCSDHEFLRCHCHRCLLYRSCNRWPKKGAGVGAMDHEEELESRALCRTNPAPSHRRSASSLRECVSLDAHPNLNLGEVWWLLNSPHPSPVLFYIHYFKIFSISFQS